MSERDLFIAALKITESTERAAWLDRECGGDAGLRQRIDVLLEAFEKAGSLLENPFVAAPTTVTIDRPVSEGSGITIGPYKLVEPIGEGGMGAVWMAQQTEPVKRLVAVKLIKAGMGSAQVVARFEAERQALALMDHPNIARVLDAGTTNSGRPYFVMDLVKGVPITKYCDEHHLTPRQRLELFIPVCQAVQHAHQKGIIHRDLKPSNVLVAPYDGNPVPKVIDFGVAKAAGQQLTDHTLVTGFGAVVGTPEYMSPEQAEFNNSDIDTRSDIYALGVLLYELLTGTPPFSRKELEYAGMMEILRVIREDEPAKPSTRLSTADGLPALAANRGTEPKKLTTLVRGELDWIVMKALEKDRARRYETANGFARDIQRYLADETVEACPPSTGYRLRKFARRNKGGLAMAGLVLFFLVLLGSVIGWTMRDRSAREAEAARQQRERQAKLAGKVESILGEVDRLKKEQKWPETLEAARRAEAAAAGGEAGPATAEQVSQRLKELEFIDRLERIRMEKATLVEGSFNNSGADRDYARAFREYGVDVDELPVETSIDQLKARPALAVVLAAALDDWVFTRRQVSEADVARWKRLVAVARGIDPEPLRDRVRATWGQPVAAVRDEVRRLADSIDVRTQHPATLVILALGLQRAQHPDAALRILQEAQHLHPGDFWLNFELGQVLYHQNDHEGSIRFYTTAVAIRPSSAGAHNNLGIGLATQKKLGEAVACYRKAIELDPKDANAHSNLGIALNEQGMMEEAVAEHRKAIEVEPRLALPHTNLGEALRGQGKLEESVAECRQAIELDPKLANAHSNLGIALQDQGKVEEAVAECRSAVALDPKFAPAHSSLGDALRGQGKLDEAVAECRKAIALDPKYAPAHNSVGIALHDQKKLDEAIAEFRKAIELDPRDAKAHNSLGNGLREQGKLEESVAEHRKAIELDPENAKAHSNLGNALRAQKKPDEAVAEHRKAIELDPKDSTPRFNLGNALRAQKKPDEAVAEYLKAIELGMRHANAYGGLGNALHDQKKLPEAIAAFRKAIELDPKDAGAHVNLGVALKDQGKLEEAVAEYRKAIELDPKLAMPHYNLGNDLRDQGKLEEAVAEYRKAIALDAQDAPAHNSLAAALWEQMKPDEAVAEFHKAIELDPKYAKAQNNLGNALRAQKKLPDAIAAYNKAIELDPKYANAHVNLGIALKAKGDLDGAERAYREAVHLEGEHHGAAIDTLAELLLSRGNWKEAVATYQKIMILDPKNTRAHYHLGIALKAMGDLDEAIAAFEEGIRRQPDFSSAHFGLASALAEAKQWDRSASVFAAALKRFGAPLSPGPWYEAIRSDEVFSRLTAQQLDDRLPRIMRARLHVLERDWKRAAADYAHVYDSLTNIDPAKLLPEGGDDLFIYGCLLLLQGDRPGYEQFCNQWADRVGDSPAWAYCLARAWGVSDAPVVPAQQIVERAGKSLPASPAPWDPHVLSLAHYRNGEFELAIKRAEESNKGRWNGSAKALNWLVLALSHSRLGHAAEARKSLQQAVELAGRASPEQPPGVEWPGMAPSDFVEYELLRREAEGLLNSKSKEEPKMN